MATADNTTSEKLMSKNVQIVAYLNVDNDLGEREVCHTLHEDEDYYAKSETRWDKNVICEPGVAERFDEDEYQELLDAEDPGWYDTLNDETFDRLQGNVGDDVVLRVMEKVHESYDNRTGYLPMTIRDEVLEGVRLALSSRDWDTWLGREVRRDGKTLFEVTYDGPMQMGLLKHQSEIEDGDVYADKDADLWAVTLTCDVAKVEPDVYRWFDENVIPDVMQEVARHPWVSRTRVMDCEREYSEEGVCYGL
jgi:hypothetical protein